MNVLITGSDGFIGQYVYRKFCEHSIWTVDKKHGEDLFDIKELKPTRCDAIVHLAAQLEILNVDPIKELRNNVQATIHMLELARKYDVPKFVFTSSADIYGEPFTIGIAVGASKEIDKPRPFWTYASSKLAAEAYVQQYEELYGIKTVIIRPSIVTGVGEWYGRFVTLSMARILQGKPILIFGDGKQTRDFVPVDNVAEIIYRATVQNIKTPEILNAGSMGRISIYEMAHMLLNTCDELGISYPNPCIKWVNPKTGELGRKPHEQINQLLDMSHTYKVIGTIDVERIDCILNEELYWLSKMSPEDLKTWMMKPRY